MALLSDHVRILKDTSRTFFIPIVRLPDQLQETVGSAYLCMRAIDEIEDHPDLDNATKAALLRALGPLLQAKIASGQSTTDLPALEVLFAPFQAVLPEVTLRIGDWLQGAPSGIAPRIWDATIAMAERMAYWADNGWRIETEADLDSYTFSVAGAVGLLICDIWGWFDGSQIDRRCAVQFGRGLQAVNILRNRGEDVGRGVNFFPHEWTEKHMFDYARKYLGFARQGLSSMPKSSFTYFVDIPLRLAEATLGAIEGGVGKLTREQVLRITGQD
jgi:farnesyl-diphosphate farnesyltransferase